MLPSRRFCLQLLLQQTNPTSIRWRWNVVRVMFLVGAFLHEGASGLTQVGAADTLYFPQGAVAADHPLASAAGVEILQQGGNVIDAAVATALCLSVVRPESSGLGGGGFLLHWNAERQVGTAWDYRERAPLAATTEMYANAVKQGIREPSVHGMLAVAVPGQIPGLHEIHRREGRLPWKAVVAPALRLATEGVEYDAFARSTSRNLMDKFRKNPELQQGFPILWSRYLREGQLPGETDRFYSPQTPALRWLSEQGLRAYTHGPIGEALVDFSSKHRGLLQWDDLRSMLPVARSPLQGQLAGHLLLTMPPPSSGGVAILQTINILEAWDRVPGQTSWKQLSEIDRQHLVVEAVKHAFADRAEFLGDADFVDVPIQRLLSQPYADALASKLRLEGVSPIDTYGRAQLPDDAGTTHFCVMDAAGNAVACTETINTTYGSYMVEPVTGMVLNNEMDDFTAIPGEANAFGLRQSLNNVVAPHKKPLSSMSPSIVVRDGRAVAIAGGSGGPRIITATLQVLLRMLVDDASAATAVSGPRWHHQWQPDVLLLEPNWEKLQAPMTAKGHRVERAGGLAAVQAIKRTSHGLEPASDPRKHGQPAGY